MTDAEREERAQWKLEQAGYRITRDAGRWHVWRGDFDTASGDSLADLAQLADRVYADHWTGRKITPSA